MKIRAVFAAATLVLSGATVLTTTSPAFASLPRCTSYLEYVNGPGQHVRVPSVGYGGSVSCLLRRGDHNEGVRVLQYMIACNNRANNPDGTLRVQRDGDFGPITESALRLVQADKGITVDGIYGPQTRDHTSWPTFDNGIFVGCTY
jgi:peptidoglycan hydrolase-like protein with peptidoglycan-binding domain